MTQSTLIFIDIETGGLNFDSPIIEFAAIAVESGTFWELDRIDCKIDFDMSKADPVALGVNKFSPTLWEKYAIPEEDAAKKLAQFLKRHASIDRTTHKEKYRIAQLAAHNAEFDVSRLAAWFERLDLFFPALRKGLCTEQLARWFVEARQELAPPYDYKLGTLAVYFSLEIMPDHSALADTETALQLAKRVAHLHRVPLKSAA